MNRNLAVCSMSLLLVAAACASGGSSGGVEADATTTAVEAPTTTEAATTTTVAEAATTTVAGTVVVIPPLPTVAPPPVTIARCRNVGTLYDPTGTRRDYDIRIGDCGLGVLELQGYLNAKLGYILEEDGEFGPATDAAVREFQMLVDLPVTGIVDLSTYIAVVSDDYDPADA